MPISILDLPTIHTHICELIRALESYDPELEREQWERKPRPKKLEDIVVHPIRKAQEQLLADLMPSGVDYNLLPAYDIVKSQLDRKTKAVLEKLLQLLGPSFSPRRQLADTMLKLEKWAGFLDRPARTERQAPAIQQEDRPKQLLTGWRNIAAALNQKYSQRGDIKSLNDRFDGPIKNSGAGTRPMVWREDLITWWDRLVMKQQELANQREGARLSAGAHYSYSRDGTVAPEIGGSVKKRRRVKRT